MMTALSRRHVLAGAAATAACAAVPVAVAAKPRTTVADYVKDIAAGFLDEETALHKLQLETREQLVECMRLNGLTLLQNRAPTWMRRVE
jgi:hypothetical protein